MDGTHGAALSTVASKVLRKSYTTAAQELDHICEGASRFQDFICERMKYLKEKLTLVEKQIAKLFEEKQSLQGKITAKETSITKLERECESLQRSIWDAESKIETARNARDAAERRQSENSGLLWIPIAGWLAYPIIEIIQGNNRIIAESQGDINYYSSKLRRNSDRLNVLKEEVRDLERSRDACEKSINERHRTETALKNEIAELQQSKVAWSEVKQTTDQAERNSSSLRDKLKTQMAKKDAVNAPHRAFQNSAQQVDSNWQNVETAVSQNIEKLLQGGDRAIASKYLSLLGDLRN